MNTSRVVILSLEGEGLFLSGPESPPFQAALNPNRNRNADVLLPYAVLLENRTNQTIIAFSIRWECKAASGAIVPQQVTLWNFDTYRGGNAIAAGGTRLVSSVVGVGTSPIPSSAAYVADIDNTAISRNL